MPLKKPPQLHYLRQWREFRRMTQEQLADAVGTSKAVISLLESENRGLSDKWAHRLAKPLRTTPGALFDYDPQEDRHVDSRNLAGYSERIASAGEARAAGVPAQSGGLKMRRLAIALLFWCTAASAQEPDYQARDEAASLRTEVERLKAEVGTLEMRVDSLEIQAERNLKMWQRQIDHDTDKALRDDEKRLAPKPPHH